MSRFVPADMALTKRSVVLSLASPSGLSSSSSLHAEMTATLASARMAVVMRVLKRRDCTKPPGRHGYLLAVHVRRESRIRNGATDETYGTPRLRKRQSIGVASWQAAPCARPPSLCLLSSCIARISRRFGSRVRAGRGRSARRPSFAHMRGEGGEPLTMTGRGGSKAMMIARRDLRLALACVAGCVFVRDVGAQALDLS